MLITTSLISCINWEHFHLHSHIVSTIFRGTLICNQSLSFLHYSHTPLYLFSILKSYRAALIFLSVASIILILDQCFSCFTGENLMLRSSPDVDCCFFLVSYGRSRILFFLFFYLRNGNRHTFCIHYQLLWLRHGQLDERFFGHYRFSPTVSSHCR